MRRLLGVVAIIVSGVILLAGCGAGSVAFPAGKWTATNASGDTAVMEYKSDGTWSLTAAGSTDAVSAGSYATDGATFTFKTDTYCKAQNAEQGTYSWTHADDQLTLKKQSDSCADRVGVMDGTVWKPAP